MSKQFSRSERNSWVVEHWPKAMIFLAITRSSCSIYSCLKTICFYSYYGYKLPSTGSINLKSTSIGALLSSSITNCSDNWPVTKRFSFWINIPIIFVAFPLSAILAGSIRLGWGIWIVYFSVVNALSHVGMFFRFGYNPGFVVSLLLNIPVGIYTLYVLQTVTQSCRLLILPVC